MSLLFIEYIGLFQLYFKVLSFYHSEDYSYKIGSETLMRAPSEKPQ